MKRGRFKSGDHAPIDGKMKCRDCDKLIFTSRKAAKLFVRQRQGQAGLKDQYQCPFHDGIFHVTSKEKHGQQRN